MRYSRKLFALLFAFLLIPAIAAAETVYVSDQLVITFRQGKSMESKTLKTLKTGTPLEVLEREKGDNYVKVRLASGEEGYVLGQYLTSETPKSIIISRLEKQIENFRQQAAQATAKLAASSKELNAVREKQTQKEGALTKNVNELNQALAAAKDELRTVAEKYKALQEHSGKVVEITNERDRLKKTNAELSAQIRALTMENSDFQRAGAIKWFLAGGGVLLLGWIIGKASRKKKGMF